MVSMAAGGCIGSTAGGVKLFRVIVLLTTTALVLRRTRLPDHAVVEARIGGQRLEAEEIAGAYHVVLLYVLMIVLSWLPFLASGYDALGSLFEVVSATTTTGLSAGIASPNLPDPLRAVLCLDMLLGRLEIVAILVFLYPGTWWGRRRVAT
jgi:trk system potassium uptake protein TrkH